MGGKVDRLTTQALSLGPLHVVNVEQPRLPCPVLSPFLKPVLKTIPAMMTGASVSPDSLWELGTLGFYPSLQVAGITLGASSWCCTEGFGGLRTAGPIFCLDA